MGQSSENSRDLTICGAYDPADFTDVQTLPGIIAPTGFFDPAGLSDGVSPSELKRYREAELTHGRVAMLASLGFLVASLVPHHSSGARSTALPSTSSGRCPRDSG